MTEKIKIILVDDHAVVRAGFRMLLAASEFIDVISEASRGEEAIGQYVNLKPDIVVMDLSMPGLGGLETIHRIVQRDGRAKILVFSVYHQRVYVNRALNAGAKGYITKNSAPEILTEAIVTIMQGQNYIEQGLIKTNSSITSQSDYQAIIHKFSPREFDVFRMLAQGMSVQKIAAELCLGYKTIANYATQIRKKLQVDTLIDLAHIAEDFGLM
jgi:two-component system, NarL family, invasion response regulator UvrY